MKALASTLSPVARALLADLQTVNAMGEGSLKSWGIKRRPQLTLTQVEVRAAELVEAGLATREVRPDGRSVYRARERAPEPAPVEVVTEPEPEWIPNCVPVESFRGVDRSPEPKKKARKAPPAEKLAIQIPTEVHPDPLRDHRYDRLEAHLSEVRAERDRLAEALLSWERLWGVNGTDLMAMEARIQEAEGRLAAVERERDQLAAALVKAKAPATTEPALSALARLPVEQRRIVGLALQELSLEALGGALGAARAEAFAARPDLAPRLSANAAAVLEILHTDRGQTPREIGKKSRINQHSVHSALRSLEKRGLATNATYGFWRRAKP